MKKLLSVAACLILLLSGCSKNDSKIDTPSSEPASSEITSSMTESSAPSIPPSSAVLLPPSSTADSTLPSSAATVVTTSKPSAPTTAYTSVELIRYDVKKGAEYEKAVSSFKEKIIEVEQKISKIASKEKKPKTPRAASTSGFDFYIRFFNGDKLAKEYSISSSTIAKKSAGKFVEWYDIDDEFHQYVKDLVVVPHTVIYESIGSDGKSFGVATFPPDTNGEQWDNIPYSPKIDPTLTAKVSFTVKDTKGNPIENFYCAVGFSPPQTSNDYKYKDYNGFTDSNGTLLLEFTQDYYWGSIESLNFVWEKNFKLKRQLPTGETAEVTSTEKDGFFTARLMTGRDRNISTPKLNETITFDLIVEEIIG